MMCSYWPRGPHCQWERYIYLGSVQAWSPIWGSKRLYQPIYIFQVMLRSILFLSSIAVVSVIVARLRQYANTRFCFLDEGF